MQDFLWGLMGFRIANKWFSKNIYGFVRKIGHSENILLDDVLSLEFENIIHGILPQKLILNFFILNKETNFIMNTKSRRN